MLVADVIGFAESRLCKRDENVHCALKRLRLIRLDDIEKESANMPHYGLALYVKEYFHVQKVVKLHCQSCEFILATMHQRSERIFSSCYIVQIPKRFTD